MLVPTSTRLCTTPPPLRVRDRAQKSADNLSQIQCTPDPYHRIRVDDRPEPLGGRVILRKSPSDNEPISMSECSSRCNSDALVEVYDRGKTPRPRYGNDSTTATGTVNTQV
jgi:hypothetical protein